MDNFTSIKFTSKPKNKPFIAGVPIVGETDKTTCFYAMVINSDAKDLTCTVRLFNGMILDNVRVLSTDTWITIDENKDYLTGKRNLPPKNTTVLCICPEGCYSNSFIIGSFFCKERPEHIDFKADSEEKDDEKLEDIVKTYKRINNSGWTIEEDIRTGTTFISDNPVEADSEISLKIDKSTENYGELSDKKIITLNIFGSTLNYTLDDDNTEISIESDLGKTKVLLNKDKVSLETENPIELTGKDTLDISTDKDINIKSQQKGINVNVKGNAVIEATGNVELKSNGLTKIGNSSTTIGAFISELLTVLQSFQTTAVCPVTGSPVIATTMPTVITQLTQLATKWSAAFN